MALLALLDQEVMWDRKVSQETLVNQDNQAPMVLLVNPVLQVCLEMLEDLVIKDLPGLKDFVVIQVVQDFLDKEETSDLLANQGLMEPLDSLVVQVIQGHQVILELSEFRVRSVPKVKQVTQALEAILVRREIRDKEETMANRDRPELLELEDFRVHPDQQVQPVLSDHREFLDLWDRRDRKDRLVRGEIRDLKGILAIQAVKVPLVLGEILELQEHQEILLHRVLKDPRA